MNHLAFLSADARAELHAFIVGVVDAEVVRHVADGLPTATSPYLTVSEAATHLRCTRQRVYDLLSARRLRRYKDGTRTLVSRAEVEQHIRSQRGRP